MHEQRFELIAPFKPHGSQPQAIESLVRSFQQGAKRQTLLGVTGSGKSLDGNEPVLVFIKKKLGGFQPKVVSIGELVDEVILNDPRARDDGTGTTISHGNSDCHFTLSFSPTTGRSELKPITAFTRHQAPKYMFHMQTACGREALMTGDHNVWVLRDGILRLVRTEHLKKTDYLPVPKAIPEPTIALDKLDVIQVLRGEKLYVHAYESLTKAIAAGKYEDLFKVLSAHYQDPRSKLFSVKHQRRGQGIQLHVFEELLNGSGALLGHWQADSTVVVGKSTACKLPAQLPLDVAVLKLIGYYIAEGNSQLRYVILANHEAFIRHEIRTSLAKLGLGYSVRPSSDIQISSTPFTKLMSRLCGAKASKKRLPFFWAQLSNQQLRFLLTAYFDGDAGVEKNSIVCVTASRQLASDVSYALFRFGIWARVRKVWKRAMNTNHSGAWYWKVSISGQANLRSFRDNIGFSVTRKATALEKCCQRSANSNVDVIPGCGAQMRELRNALGLSQRDLAAHVGINRSALSMIENGKRNPQRTTMLSLLENLKHVARQQRNTNASLRASMDVLQSLCQLHWTPVEKVVSVKYDRAFVYDLSVKDNETFFAGFGGLFVHNTFTIAHVIQAVQKPTLVLAHNKTLAAQLCNEFRAFFPNNAVHYFVSYYDYYQPEAYVPQTDTYIEKDASINDEIDRLRHAATSSLLERRDVIIVASVSCIYGLGSPQDYAGMTLSLEHGQFTKRDDILKRLVEIQYERNDVGFERGTFRVRGDTIEIIPIYGENVVRIELFGDEVERIREVDPLTGKLFRELHTVAIYPGSHFVTSKDKLKRAVETIGQELGERLRYFKSKGKLLEEQRLQMRTKYDLEMIQELGYCSGIENYSRHLAGRDPGSTPSTLMDFFPEDYLFVIDESHQTIPQVRGMYHGDKTRKETLVEHGFRLPSALDNRPLTFAEFEARMPQVIFVSATPGPYEKQHSEQVVEQIIRPTGLVDPEVVVLPVAGQIDDLLEQVKVVTDRGERALVTTLTKKMAEDLTDYLASLGIKARYLHSEIDTLQRVEILRDLRLGQFDVLVGINLLREGLDLPEVSLVAILDADKEGFLRSDTSLVQTIGRAARNLRGRVVLYADKVTDSMQRALSETRRRRQLQLQYNAQHGITPESVKKEISDIVQALGLAAKDKEEADKPVSVKELVGVIQQLEKEMLEAAKQLEFERAARIRDEIKELRRDLVGVE